MHWTQHLSPFQYLEWNVSTSNATWLCLLMKLQDYFRESPSEHVHPHLRLPWPPPSTLGCAQPELGQPADLPSVFLVCDRKRPSWQQQWHNWMASQTDLFPKFPAENLSPHCRWPRRSLVLVSPHTPNHHHTTTHPLPPAPIHTHHPHILFRILSIVSYILSWVSTGSDQSSSTWKFFSSCLSLFDHFLLVGKVIWSFHWHWLAQNSMSLTCHPYRYGTNHTQIQLVMMQKSYHISDPQLCSYMVTSPQLRDVSP